LGGLDLAVVPDLIAEAEEGVLDLSPRLRDRVEMPDRELVPGPRDVDRVAAECPVELRTLELGAAAFDPRLQPLAKAVERHAGLPVSTPSQRLGELAPAAEVADTRVFELRQGAGRRNRGLGVFSVLVPVHCGDCIVGPA